MRIDGVWSAAQVAAFLDAAVIPIRLAVCDGGGVPVPVSLWFLPEADALWCATRRTARMVAWLERSPRCGFEVAADAPPYRGVRGSAEASLHPGDGAAVLERLLARYRVDPASRLARDLRAKADREVAIRLTPRRVTSWDFTARMAGAMPA